MMPEVTAKKVLGDVPSLEVANLIEPLARSTFALSVANAVRCYLTYYYTIVGRSTYQN